MGVHTELLPMTSYARSIHRTIPHMKFSLSYQIFLYEHSFNHRKLFIQKYSLPQLLSQCEFPLPTWLLIQESLGMEHILHTWTTYCASCKVVHSYVVNSHNSFNSIYSSIISTFIPPFISIELNPRLVWSTDPPITFLPAVTKRSKEVHERLA